MEVKLGLRLKGFHGVSMYMVGVSFSSSACELLLTIQLSLNMW